MPTLIMSPTADARMVGFVGDRVRFTLRVADGQPPAGWRAVLRTNLGRAASERDALVASLGAGQTYGGASWRDIPMTRDADGWFVELSLTKVGFVRAKAYAADAQGRQHWPDGGDAGLSVHPDSQRTANTIYCAFVRSFGATKHHRVTRNGLLEEQFTAFDRAGYTLIPPSGTLRDLTAQIPHIVDRLGCRIIHLLPVNPTPTTFARMGRFGSPYAAQDFTDIDPALVVFDKCTTAVDQFRELTYAAHLKGAQVFLDLAANHTGWGAHLQNEHPEWFQRNRDGSFHSPGAWGTVWEDLVELDHQHHGLWEHLAQAFLTWCRRGVDGFRCDAGYMVPKQAWQYIIASVRREFPSTIFLLEGLGGAWHDTESLLTEGGMQWAYSELFQNHSAREVATYLDHAHRQSRRVGLLVHYSETHDNDRLAKGGRTWSLLRNRLSALTSVSGAFGFTCGVEWLANEKLDVHENRGLAWGSGDNLVAEISLLTQLLSENPCFFDGAVLARLSDTDAPIYALRRDSAEGKDQVLVVANTDLMHAQTLRLGLDRFTTLAQPVYDLLLEDPAAAPVSLRCDGDGVFIELAAGECRCLSPQPVAVGLSGERYRRMRAQSAWALRVLSHVLEAEEIGPHDWRLLAALVEEHSLPFVGAVWHLDRELARQDLLAAITKALAHHGPPQVVPWSTRDLRRVTPVPPGHLLLIRDSSPFSATLRLATGGNHHAHHVRSVPVGDGHVACCPPHTQAGDYEILFERFAAEGRQTVARVRFLAAEPQIAAPRIGDGVALLTNGLGGMARIQVDLGTVASKYDCLLGANLHASAPCDRHILAKRVRAWVNADGFISALGNHNLATFTPGPPATWTFVANAGDGRTVAIQLDADLMEGRNTVVLRWSRPAQPAGSGSELPERCTVRLSVRIDIEDRSFHSETIRDASSEAHFARHTTALDDRAGFRFAPAEDRRLVVTADSGTFHAEGEWCTGIPHPIEAGRGQRGSGDAFSPGWFDLPLTKSGSTTVTVCADAESPTPDLVAGFAAARGRARQQAEELATLPRHDHFGRTLARAVSAYVVRRGDLKTVIAGYPWFLDWGRDSLICARGLISAGLTEEVRQLLIAFGRFEAGGTLPNFLNGDDASNRDTSDAPLWYGVVCEELAAALGREFYTTPVDDRGRTIADVLTSIANGYLRGTANGITVDRLSGLVWSPSHFTWMDTNHPAGTPREGYPIEIQALWIRLLRQLERLKLPAADEPWWALAERASEHLTKHFWLEERGYFSDLLIAQSGVAAAQAVVDNALRSNQLMVVSLGLVDSARARRCVAAATRYLFVPGALRTLAPLPVEPPLAIHGPQGQLLNDPLNPYWGRYEGDEDSRRKPAYHNGTAWTWTFPGACEALARAWDFTPTAVATARAYLGSMDHLLNAGCFGHLPEIIDGDAPHAQRGCDAQAWGATEALRVWKLLAAH